MLMADFLFNSFTLINTLLALTFPKTFKLLEIFAEPTTSKLVSGVSVLIPTLSP